jgi:hypothetical protein
MQTAHWRWRPSGRALAPVCALAGLSGIGMAVSGLISPAFPQAPGPVTLDLVNLFYDEHVFNQPGPEWLEKLKDATNCYPQATFTVGFSDAGLFEGSYTKMYAKNLVAAFVELGLDPARFKIETNPKGDNNVRVTYPNSAAGKATDGPKLKTSSVPKKGTRVKTGDTIKVTITASERYEDGHKSWPTGVRSIQLLANDGKVADKDYGMRPPPCERRTEVMTYIVPSKPPPIVRLHALAEDAVGNQNGEDGDFPTVDVWTGIMHSETTGNYGPAGICTGESWDNELRLLVGGDGEVTGKATGHLVSMPKCSGSGFHNDWAARQGKNAAYDVAGRLIGQQFDLVFTPTRFDGGSNGLINYSLGVVRSGRPAPTIVVPLKSPRIAQGDTTTRIPVNESGGPLASGRHTVDLKCIDCQ